MSLNMKKILLLASLMVIAGCAPNETTRQQLLQQTPPWYAEGAIVVTIKTEPVLNAWQGMSNALSLVILQSKEKQTLEALISSEKQARTLFSGAALSADILSADRFTAMPGQQTTLHINRAENTRYVAIVAGYYPAPGPGQTSLMAVPVELKRSWLKWQVEVEPLHVTTVWGERALVSFSGAKNLIDEKKQTQEGAE